VSVGASGSAGDLEVLLPAERIHRRLDEMAGKISSDYAERDLVLVVFLADLVRRLDLPLRLDFLTAASYGSGTSPQRPVTLGGELVVDVRGRDCLLVDVVLDTGRTLSTARAHVLGLHPRSLGVCVLLVKSGAQEVEVPVDYVGFTVADRFLVGYGLDHAQRFRHLPYVAALREPIDGKVLTE